MSAPPRRETTLHLLYTREGQAALHTRITDQSSYFGSNVPEAAAAAGLPSWPLRRVSFVYQGDVDGVHRTESVWHMEARFGATLDWQPAADLPEREQGWLRTALTPPGNVPWMRAGWHDSALAWVDAELEAQGRARTGDPAVLKHGQISALWRVPTVAGPLYFKAVPDFFAREVELTPRLARDLPGAAPPVLAADTARGFLLLDDAGREVSEAPALDDLMVHVARLQLGSVPLIQGWNLRDRGPDYVLSWLDTLVSDSVLLVGQEDGFTAQEADHFRSLRPALEVGLHRLAVSPLPLTLGHGDLHGGNVTVRDGAFTLLDWSDVCVTHPFLDVNPAYFYPWQVDPPQDVLDHARDVYLRQWQAYAPMATLRALYADALVCGELFRALGYVDGLQGAVQDKAEWRTAHLDHLRRVLHLSAEQAWTWAP